MYLKMCRTKEDDYQIRVGTDKHSKGKLIDVGEIIPHPDYDAQKPTFDFGLMEVIHRLEYSRVVQPVGLPPSKRTLNDVSLSITGWGPVVMHIIQEILNNYTLTTIILTGYISKSPSRRV